MTTAQKRGFRFPWGSDPDRDAEPSEQPADEPSLAQRLGAAPDDLGRGPFDLGADPAEAQADDAAAAAARPDGPEAPADADEATTPTPSPAATAPKTGAAPAPVRSAWPESDRRSAPGSATTAAEPQARPTGKANPLMAGLVRAMRDAAKVARDEAVAGLRADAATRSESVRSAGAAAVAGLRKTADADVAAIREWSKAELARLREETENRITARKEQFVRQTDDQARATEATLATLAQAVGGYEAEAKDFFDRLLAEEDPARLAGLAERMPPPPPLDAFGWVDAPEVEPEAPEPEPPAEAVAPEAVAPEAVAPEAVAPDAVAPEAVAPETIAPEAVAPETIAPEAVAPEAVAPETVVAEAEAAPESGDGLDTTGGPDALDAETAAAAEAAALAGLDGQTQVIVSGLANVASIAQFKATLMQDPGVSAVSVNAGNDGDCLFTVTHAADTDVRVAVRDMTTFQTRLIADDGSTLVVVAHEAAA